MTRQQWTQETPDRREEVRVTQSGAYEQRQEVYEDIAAERNQILTKLTQFIWLVFAILEVLIGLRVLLELIGANPASPFASLIYSATDLVLWPFFGLTSSPSAGNIVLDIPALFAILVYLLVAWVIVKALWLLFARTTTRSVSTYEKDQS